jgi:hypothetical protein
VGAGETTRRTLGSRLLELIAWFSIGIIPAYLISTSSVIGGFAVGALVALIAITAIAGKLKPYRIGWMRGIGLAWVSMVFVSGSLGQQQLNEENAALIAELDALQEQSIELYLTRYRELYSDEEWLDRLEQVDPEGHAQEMDRREALRASEIEQVRVEAERLSQQAVEDAYNAALAQMAHIERDLEREVRLPIDADQIGGFLSRVDGYAQTLRSLKRQNFTGEEAARLTALLEEVSDFQTREFPRVRDAVGPAMRRSLWIDNASARTIGPGYRTIEFISGRYILNANIMDDFLTVRQSLVHLRFHSVVFRQYEDAVGTRFSVLEQLAPEDSEVVLWSELMHRRVD